VQILQALAAMLEQPGAERITTAALAARLEVSEAALYRHFRQQGADVRGADRVHRAASFRWSTRSPPSASPRACQVGRRRPPSIAMLLQFGEKNPGMTRVMVGDALVFEHERLQQRMNQFFDKIEATLRQACGARPCCENGGGARHGVTGDSACG
jgi:TetR/AcrR family transcriptional regulator